MWIRNAWYVAAWSHEIIGDGLLARTIMNEPLVLYRTSNGSAAAMQVRCRRNGARQIKRLQQETTYG